MTIQQLSYVVCIAKHKSINKAASELFLSQPSLSGAVRELEKEIGLTIFQRSNRGVVLTPEGEEFLGYARQMEEQYRLIKARYLDHSELRKKFSVSMQHYSFAVAAFIEMAKSYDMNEYDLAVHETMTHEIIEDVKNQKSEIGILYINSFNQKSLFKLFSQNNLEFQELFVCNIYVYLWKGNPLASKKILTFEELDDYPCLSFEQGDNNAFYFAEEVFSTRIYKRLIKANDRATMLNLMVGLGGFTLCSGILSEDLNGSDYCAIPLDTDEIMHIGYIKKKKMPLSAAATLYLSKLKAWFRCQNTK
ncbi:MAG: LysR family transcriptional regulator [Lachnospiraceae bacterium]